MILVIDNYDSFVHNLARYFERLGQSTRVVRNDAIDAAGVRALQPDAVIISPGPCAPEQAGSSIEIVRELCATTPILGVCLGHQAIAAAFGGRVVRATEVVHGRSSLVFHNNEGLFTGLPNPLSACRYHSLIVEESNLPAAFAVDARTDDGLIMALRHGRYPVFGVQFHPEAILTECGYELLAAFLRLSGISSPVSPQELSPESVTTPAPDDRLPTAPVTF